MVVTRSRTHHKRDDEKEEEEDSDRGSAAMDSQATGQSNPIVAEPLKYDGRKEQYLQDATIEFLFSSHTITLLCVGLLCLVWASFNHDPNATKEIDNVRIGVWTVAAGFIFVALLAFPSGPFDRPHPAVWRVVLCVGVMYWFLLLFVMFQSFSTVQQILVYMDPELAKPVMGLADDPDYAQDCEFTYAKVMKRVDIFCVLHFCGWVCKAMILRSNWMLWTLSICWEFTEMAFVSMLPNFEECWWDKWLLDVAFANAGGIVVGMWLLRYFRIKELKWETLFTQSTPDLPLSGEEKGIVKNKLKKATIKNKVKWTALQFIPRFEPMSYDFYPREKTQASFARFIMVYAILFMMIVSELSSFFLKHIFRVPTDNMINCYRLFIQVFVGLPAMRQFYMYCTDPNCKRWGAHLWVMSAVILTELLVCLRFGMFLRPTGGKLMPIFEDTGWKPTLHVMLFSAVMLSGMTMYISHRYYQLPKASQKKQRLC